MFVWYYAHGVTVWVTQSRGLDRHDRAMTVGQCNQYLTRGLLNSAARRVLTTLKNLAQTRLTPRPQIESSTCPEAPLEIICLTM